MLYIHQEGNCIFSLFIILSLRQVSEIEKLNGDLKNQAKSHAEKLKEIQTSKMRRKNEQMPWRLN